MRPRRRLDLAVLAIWILFIFFLYQHRHASSDEAWDEDLGRALPYETEHEKLPYGYYHGEDVVGGPEVPIQVQEKGEQDGGKEHSKAEDKSEEETTVGKASMTTELLPQAETTVKSVLDGESAVDGPAYAESTVESESPAVNSVSAPAVLLSTPAPSMRSGIGESLIDRPSGLASTDNTASAPTHSASRFLPDPVEAIGKLPDGNASWVAPELRDAE